MNASVTGGLTWNITENVIFDFVYTGFIDGKQLFSSDALKIAFTVKF